MVPSPHARTIEGTGNLTPPGRKLPSLPPIRPPLSLPPTDQNFKYRLYYGRKGERIVGCDNERGKGDHRHLGAVEKPYAFATIEQLLEDFERDVARVRKGPL